MATDTPTAGPATGLGEAGASAAPADGRVSRAALLNAAPDFATAAAFLVTWIAPATFGEQTLKKLMLVMFLEFVVVHSAAFTGAVAVADLGRGKRAG